MAPSQTFECELEVYPDYVDINEHRGRTLTVRYAGDTTDVVRALFSATHKITDQGLEIAWPSSPLHEHLRIISRDSYELLLGVSAAHELALLLALSAAYHLEQRGRTIGTTTFVMIDPFEVASRKWLAMTAAPDPGHSDPSKSRLYTLLGYSHDELVERAEVICGPEAAARVRSMSDHELEDLVASAGSHLVEHDRDLVALDYALSGMG